MFSDNLEISEYNDLCVLYVFWENYFCAQIHSFVNECLNLFGHKNHSCFVLCFLTAEILLIFLCPTTYRLWTFIYTVIVVYVVFLFHDNKGSYQRCGAERRAGLFVPTSTWLLQEAFSPAAVIACRLPSRLFAGTRLYSWVNWGNVEWNKLLKRWNGSKRFENWSY